MLPGMDQIERVDTRVRFSCMGMSAAEIEPLAHELLSDLGVPRPVLRDYSRAVEQGEAFSLVRLLARSALPTKDDDLADQP